MKYIGHPLFNDATYGGDKVLRHSESGKFNQFVKNAFDLCPRQALHAQSLGFLHPKTKKFVQFNTDLPDDIGQLLDKWRNYVNNQ